MYFDNYDGRGKNSYLVIEPALAERDLVTGSVDFRVGGYCLRLDISSDVLSAVEVTGNLWDGLQRFQSFETDYNPDNRDHPLGACFWTPGFSQLPVEPLRSPTSITFRNGSLYVETWEKEICVTFAVKEDGRLV